MIMGAKMEVLPNSLLKGRGSSTATWGGGTLGRVGGRRRRRRRIRSTSFTTSFLYRLEQHQAVQPSGRPSSPPASYTEEEVSSIQAMLQGHGGVFGLGMEGPEDDGGEGNHGREEKNTKRAESNIAPPRLGETSS